MLIQIWISGYAATGEHATASLLDTVEAESFDDAINIYSKKNKQTHIARAERYVICPVSKEHPLGRKLATVYSIWAMRLHDNEKDAREIFG